MQSPIILYSLIFKLLYFLIGIAVYFAVGYVILRFRRSKALKGITFNNGYVMGIDPNKAKYTELNLPLSPVTSTCSEALIIFLLLSFYEVYHIIDFLTEGSQYIHSYDITLPPSKEAIRNFFLLHATILFVSLWIVFTSAHRMIQFPHIRFDKYGMHTRSKDAQTITIQCLLLLIPINLVFNGLMYWVWNYQSDVYHFSYNAPILYIYFAIISDIIIIYYLIKKNDVPRFASFIIRFLAFNFWVNVKSPLKSVQLKTIDNVNLPAKIEWKDITKIEHRVWVARNVDLKHPRSLKDDSIQMGHLYHQGLKIEFRKGVAKGFILLLDDSNFSMCQKLTFLKHHDHRIFLPLATLCKVQKVNFMLLTDH